MAIRFNLTHGMHSRVRKLDEKMVRAIRNGKGKFTAKQLGEKYKIHSQTVRSIWAKKLWAHLEE